MKRICLYIGEERKMKLQEIAKKEEISFNALVNRIIKEFLKKNN